MTHELRINPQLGFGPRVYAWLFLAAYRWAFTIELRRCPGWVYARRPKIEFDGVYINTPWIAVWLHWRLPEWVA